MFKKQYWIAFYAILIFSFVLRVIPLQNYNFYFTIDQADQAIHVREITEFGKLLFKGPETSMPGVYAGPLWLYFNAFGVKLFSADPLGEVFMVIFLSFITTGFIMWEFSRRISPKAGLLAGVLLQGYWYYFELSRYSFNPFPMGILGFWYVFYIIRFFQDKQKAYFYAFFPIFLMFNCEVASAIVFTLFHFIVGVYGMYKKSISFRPFMAVWAILGLISSPLILQLFKQFLKSGIINSEVGSRGFFSGFNFIEMSYSFVEIFQRSIIPQSFVLSLLILILLLIIVYKQKSKISEYQKHFIIITYLLFAFSYLFFSLNKAWRDWHTLYLYPLLFLSIYLLCINIKKFFGVVFLSIIVFAQLLTFKDRYQEILKPTDDPGLLVNQLKVYDWIYTHSEGDGFNAYTFSPHVYDDQQQYLFWWYGRKTYGFVPCEYTLFPGFLKHTYVPSPENYATPTLGCDNLRFLIIESPMNQKSYEIWREKVKFDRGIKVEEVEINKTKIEKWRIIPRT